MKKLLILLAAAAATIANVGCEIDADLEGSANKIVLGISVESDSWEEYMVDGRFDHWFADVEMPVITDYILKNGAIHTYLKYNDNGVEVQEEVGFSKPMQRWDDHEQRWIEYTETINCSYSSDNMRVEFHRSDFVKQRPGTLLLRTVITW